MIAEDPSRLTMHEAWTNFNSPTRLTGSHSVYFKMLSEWRNKAVVQPKRNMQVDSSTYTWVQLVLCITGCKYLGGTDKKGMIRRKMQSIWFVKRPSTMTVTTKKVQQPISIKIIQLADIQVWPGERWVAVGSSAYDPINPARTPITHCISSLNPHSASHLHHHHLVFYFYFFKNLQQVHHTSTGGNKMGFQKLHLLATTQ